MTSLYELVNSWEKPGRMRFVENFSANEYNTNRWKENEDSGDNDFEIANEDNGGFKITTGTSGGNDNGRINFEGVNQFNPYGSVMVSTIRKTSADDCRVRCGFAQTWTTSLNMAYTDIATDTGSEKVRLTVAAHTSLSYADTSHNVSTDWIDSKLELKPSGSFLSINGVLEAQLSVNPQRTDVQYAINEATLEPNFYVLALSGTASRIGQIRYMECYNT